MPLNPKFEIGENVKIPSIGKIGTINKILEREDTFSYQITLEGKKSAYLEQFLEKNVDEEQEIFDSFESNEFAVAEDFRLFQTWFRLKRPIEGHFYSYLASKTVFNPYQFKPLSIFISPGSEERLFIADEVGVGKTIETGIILTELIARKRIDRRKPILIVCPSSLGLKWASEMKERFNFTFYLHEKTSTVKKLLESVHNGNTPEGMEWSIVSFSLLSSKKNFKILQEIHNLRDKPFWSMVIVDEAHWMRNTGRIRNKEGLMLSELTEMMLMLSATPLNLSDGDLYNQMHILNPLMFPNKQMFSALLSPVKSINRCRQLLIENNESSRNELLKELSKMNSQPLGEAISSHDLISSLKKDLSTGKNLIASEIALYDKTLLSLNPLNQSFTRTLKKEAFKQIILREIHKVPVSLSENERRFYDAVIRVLQDLYLEKGGNPKALGFISETPRRMVTSCIPAMKEHLSWCIKDNKMIDISKYESGEYSEEDVEDYLKLAKSTLPIELRKQFISLHNMAKELKDEDTKYQEFSNLVRRLLGTQENPQMIVYSSFIETLQYLKMRLTEEGYKVGLVHGKVPLHSEGKRKGRFDIMKSFESKELDILLSSEVGGEGLDFQFCQTIINYDLPYNPMKLEQRIGRVDRHGQNAEKVVIVSMYLKDTVDEKIYSVLYDRIKLAQESIGDLQPIISEKVADLQKDIISGKLSEAQIEKKTKEIEIAIEKVKIEEQKFDVCRNELPGDEYFNKILFNIEKQSEFVQPADASRLTSICLNSWDGCKYEEKDDDFGFIKLSKEIKSDLEKFTLRPGSEGSRTELNQLLESKSRVPVIFNGSLTSKHRDCLFLPPCGFWVQFLLDKLESEGKISRVFSFFANSTDLNIESGEFIVPIFEVTFEGFHEEVNLAAVPVNIREKTIRECNFKEFIRIIGNESSQSNNDPFFNINENLDDFVEIGRGAVERQFNEKKMILEIENEYRIKTRLNANQKSTEIDISKYEKEIEKHKNSAIGAGKEPSESFIKRIESQILSCEKRKESLMTDIQSKCNLSLSSKLVGIVLLKVT